MAAFLPTQSSLQIFYRRSRPTHAVGLPKPIDEQCLEIKICYKLKSPAHIKQLLRNLVFRLLAYNSFKNQIQIP